MHTFFILHPVSARDTNISQRAHIGNIVFFSIILKEKNQRSSARVLYGSVRISPAESVSAVEADTSNIKLAVSHMQKPCIYCMY